MNHIKVKGLSKSYSDIKALKNLSMEIEAGTLFGILGPNGAGKSTLIKILATLIEPDSGEVLINNINLTNTNRPIAGDKCWVINCEIKDTCNFWLSFEKDDISSLKSISLSKPNQKPSIIESFLIDEKRITLKLIISRVLQRLNGQKLIGVN